MNVLAMYPDRSPTAKVGTSLVSESKATHGIESVAQTGKWRRLTKVLLKRREFTPEIAAKSAHLFSVHSITGAYLQLGFVDCSGKGVYRGANPPGGALLTVWLKEFTGDEIKIEITKASGRPVANLKAPGAPGFTRLNWDLRPPKTSVSSRVVTIRSDCCLPAITLPS
jgi:hypothetical protein